MYIRKVNIQCPSCCKGIYLESNFYNITETSRTEETIFGFAVFGGFCPLCDHLIIFREGGNLYFDNESEEVISTLNNRELLYPNFVLKELSQEIPEKYKQDFLEAYAIQSISPKASAALSRRILQNLLREELGIYKPSLAQEIDEFIQKTDVPSYLTDAVDAIRNIGNFAAHPLKDTNTGEIVEVEAGEAEWLLEVNESLFDFVFVQPIRLEERKNSLNAKLASLGKPPMKS